MPTRYLFIISLLFFASCTTGKYLTVQQTAKSIHLSPGAPKYSDVCFSSRWERPRNEQDTFETFSAARGFHATWLNWVYTTNPIFIKKARSLGYKMQIALTPTLADLPFGSGTNNNGRIINLKGEKVTAPWMKGMDNWWGCVNNPIFQEAWFEHIKVALEAGVEGFQVDDPAMGFLLVRNKWEDLCYCDYCNKKADSLGVQPADIQQVSAAEFHKNMKYKAEVFAGRPVPFSCNNFEGDWSLFPFKEFDFGVAELPERRVNAEYIYGKIREAHSLGKAQVFSFANDRDFLVQKVIATTYSCGGNQLVPWDVWMGGGRDRYFGKAETYAPYFGFVRANAEYLDGYEDAFCAATQDDPRYIDTKNFPVSFSEYNRQIHAFVRARPGDENAPVVIHIVDWEVITEPFELLLNERRFFKKGIKSIQLITPIIYDKNKHEMAEETGDFSSLTNVQLLDFQREGKSLRLKMPKMEMHWAILVVEQE